MRGPSTSAQPQLQGAVHVFHAHVGTGSRRAAATLPAPAPAAPAVSAAALQAAIVVAGRLPRWGLAPPQGKLEEPSQQERHRRGRGRTQSLHRVRLRIRFLPRGRARSSPLRYPTSSRPLLRRQQTLQRIPRLQDHAVFLRCLRLRRHSFPPRKSPPLRHLHHRYLTLSWSLVCFR